MGKRKYLFKILLASVLFGILLTGGTRKVAYAETDEKTRNIIDLSGIMSDSTGKSVVQNTYVTREEFAQMLVQASPYAGEVKKSSNSRFFKDVSQNSSKAAYVQIAVSKGYMSGYLNGKFKPTKSITLKEAIYGTLVLLGYTKNDFTGNLSGTRYDKFNELGLGENLICGEEDKLTKGNSEILFYNLMNARSKSGDIYAKVLGFPVNEDGSINYQGLLGKKTKGPYLVKSAWENSLTRKLSSYQIMLNNENASAEDIKDYNIVYYADQVNKIWVYDTKVYGCLENITYINNSPQEFTVSGKNYTVEKPDDIKIRMEETGIKKDSMIVLLLGRDDKVSSILPINSAVASANWRQTVNFDVSQGVIYKDGNKVSAEKVKESDIIYYSKEIKTVLVYSKKVYGVLKTISPSISAPDKIIVAGKTYDLKSSPVLTSGNTSQKSEDISENTWGARLRKNGIQEGDNVVVLFGYNGNIVEICKVDKMSISLSGYVLAVENKVVSDDNNENNVKRMIRIVDTEGIIREFACSDESIVKETIVEINFEAGKAVITRVDAYLSNRIADLTSKELAENIRIIEVDKLNYAKISASTFKEKKWDAGNVLYCKLNTDGEITDLIIRSVTNAFYQYGFLKKVVAPDMATGNYNFQLECDIADVESTISVSIPKWDLNPGPKAFQIENNTIKEMKDLQQVRISYISGKQANAGTEVYRIEDDVLVYYYKNGEYFKGTFEDITKNSKNILDGYMDNSQGPIRVIVVK